ncbi:MAG TPA: winged helix-turn-helix transcriptional regulator [Gemmataceae bacterium]|nr:winged helix-turn-helix transcriptional regulator [Gemmataceae bacterium]
MSVTKGNPAGSPTWAFLSNHARVLICLAADPNARMRDVATRVGVTERAVQRIVAELQQEGYMTIKRVGRRNQYTVERGRPLRHPMEAHCTAGRLIDLGTPKDLRG